MLDEALLRVWLVPVPFHGKSLFSIEVEVSWAKDGLREVLVGASSWTTLGGSGEDSQS